MQLGVRDKACMRGTRLAGRMQDVIFAVGVCGSSYPSSVKLVRDVRHCPVHAGLIRDQIWRLAVKALDIDMHRALLGIHAQHTAICASCSIIHGHCGIVLVAANVADVLRLPACTSHAHELSVLRFVRQSWAKITQAKDCQMNLPSTCHGQSQ